MQTHITHIKNKTVEVKEIERDKNTTIKASRTYDRLVI